jgi:GAF domain-containing protein
VTPGFIIVCRDVTEKKRSQARLEKYTHDLEKRVEDRTEKIRQLNETITARLVQKIGQINNISEIRDQLKKQPGVDSSFDLIMDGALRDLGMDAGGIFTVNTLERVVEVKSLRPFTVSRVKANLPLDRPFLEFESLHKNEAISRIVENEPCILGTESVHCAPISFSKKVYGVLALGSKRREVLDESDLSVLKLYSGLITTVLESTTLTVEPTKESVGFKEGKCRLDFGNSYLVADDVELAYELFSDSVLTGIEGLCITRTMPRKVREKYGLKRTPIVWLTDESIQEEKTIQSLQDLSILISNYVQKASSPVILIDGMEYLISHKGFDSVYHFMQTKRTQMEANQGILIVPFFRDAVEPKEAKLLEREFQFFSTKDSAKPAGDELRALGRVHPLA